MRNLPLRALVPLAVLASAAPLTLPAFVGPAGADMAADCSAAFDAPTSSEITYTTDPAVRLAYGGQTVSLTGAWDPAAWESLTSATACVRLDDNDFDDILGHVEAAPANTGTFSHSFTIPDDVDPGTRLCTKIALAGDPAGEATSAVWASKMHCFEVDHQDEAPPPAEETTTTTSAPPTTTTTLPAESPAGPQGTPAGEDEAPPAAPPAAPEGGDSPVGGPFDSAGDVPAPGAGVTTPAPHSGTVPETLPLLPATGYASLDLLHSGELVFFTGLGLLVLGGRRRRAA